MRGLIALPGSANMVWTAIGANALSAHHGAVPGTGLIGGFRAPPPGGGIVGSIAPAPTINVYPNPWKSSMGVSAVQFNPVPSGSTIKIFTVSGHWVKTLAAPGGSVPWDLTNDSGDRVASGIYIYLVTDLQGNKARGKVIVIR